MAALLLPAVGCPWWKACIALPAHLLVTVVRASENLQAGLHHNATAKTEHQMKGGLFLDVVIREGTSILQLLASEDQALLVGGDALLVLNFLLHVIDRVIRLDLERDCLARILFIS